MCGTDPLQCENYRLRPGSTRNFCSATSVTFCQPYRFETSFLGCYSEDMKEPFRSRLSRRAFLSSAATGAAAMAAAACGGSDPTPTPSPVPPQSPLSPLATPGLLKTYLPLVASEADLLPGTSAPRADTYADARQDTDARAAHAHADAGSHAFPAWPAQQAGPLCRSQRSAALRVAGHPSSDGGQDAGTRSEFPCPDQANFAKHENHRAHLPGAGRICRPWTRFLLRSSLWNRCWSMPTIRREGRTSTVGNPTMSLWQAARTR